MNRKNTVGLILACIVVIGVAFLVMLVSVHSAKDAPPLPPSSGTYYTP